MSWWYFSQYSAGLGKVCCWKQAIKRSNQLAPTSTQAKRRAIDWLHARYLQLVSCSPLQGKQNNFPVSHMWKNTRRMPCQEMLVTLPQGAVHQREKHTSLIDMSAVITRSVASITFRPSGQSIDGTEWRHGTAAPSRIYVVKNMWLKSNSNWIDGLSPSHISNPNWMTFNCLKHCVL